MTRPSRSAPGGKGPALRATILASVAVTSLGRPVEARVWLEGTQGCASAARGTSAGTASASAGLDEATREILADPETLRLLGEAQEDVRAGRTIRGTEDELAP